MSGALGFVFVLWRPTKQILFSQMLFPSPRPQPKTVVGGNLWATMNEYPQEFRQNFQFEVRRLAQDPSAQGGRPLGGGGVAFAGRRGKLPPTWVFVPKREWQLQHGGWGHSKAAVYRNWRAHTPLICFVQLTENSKVEMKTFTHSTLFIQTANKLSEKPQFFFFKFAGFLFFTHWRKI